MWIEVDTHASKQGLKETNIIETKQQKRKSNRKSKATEYTIFMDKFQMSEYTTFQDGGNNSLSHVKSELPVSYFKFPFKKINFLAKPIVLAAIQSPSFPSVYIAADAACAQKITAHLCQRRRQQPSPHRLEDHLDGREVA